MFTCHLANNLRDITIIKYQGINWETVKQLLLAANFELVFENHFNLTISNGSETPFDTLKSLKLYVIYHKTHMGTPIPNYNDWD
jgi:hypothetical protein